MASDDRGAATAFDRLRDRLDADSLQCPACGFEDDDGTWQVVTTGDRVNYRHVCPSCGAVDTRELRLDGRR